VAPYGKASRRGGSGTYFRRSGHSTPPGRHVAGGAAAIARHGPDRFDYLERQTVDAINDAREAGFTVNEDPSVTNTSKFDHGSTESPENETVKVVDFEQAPPPDASYPVNDVIAEATGLDGNRVLLSRGYRGGKKGFGGDKPFHAHGVTNRGQRSDLAQSVDEHEGRRAHPSGPIIRPARA
jgi:hypothetical protein